MAVTSSLLHKDKKNPVLNLFSIFLTAYFNTRKSAKKDKPGSFGSVPGDDVLDGACQDVSVVRQAGGEGRPVEEGEPGLALGLRQAGLEGVQLLPQLRNGLLLRGEVDLRRDACHHSGTHPDQVSLMQSSTHVAPHQQHRKKTAKGLLLHSPLSAQSFYVGFSIFSLIEEASTFLIVNTSTQAPPHTVTVAATK